MPKKYVKRWERGQWPRPTIEQAFWERANKVRADNCWLWSGAINDDGYGILRRKSAHRFSYEMHFGAIPKGMEIDHICCVRSCVNPRHLEVVSHTENVRRSWDRGQREHLRDRLGVSQAAKTHCSHGHEYSIENTRIDEAGRRRCRQCDNDKAKRYHRKMKRKK